MSKIHILKPEIISKIAAGEVIERPASVVKELLENALDAGASVIDVQLKEAGKNLIKIRDNGSGIAKDDLETIFLRHATSKIENTDDLYAIRSLGFRGEALYSVGAIADVTLRSQPKGQTEGWEIHLRGGKKLNLRPCAMPNTGTEIEVKELFYNTPARKKFLKSNTTEVHQILNTFLPYTLLYPKIRFALTHQDKGLIELAPANSFIERIATALNIDAKHLLERRQEFPEHELSMHLILGDINIKRPRRDMQFTFVNGRPVQNKSIAFHLNQVYRLILPEGLAPFFAVYIDLPAQNVDVNVHPAKREVKIKEEQKLCAFLRNLCEETLMKQGSMKEVHDHAFPAGRHDERTVERALMGTHTSEVTFDSSLPSDIFAAESTRDYAYPATPSRERQEFFIPEENMAVLQKENIQSKLSGARYIGSFINKFLFFETGTSLLVIDQHAAAERITYERLIRQINQGKVEVQHLLSPVLVKLSPPDMLVWEELQEQIKEIGLETNQWDAETVAVHTHPIFLKDLEKTLRYLLAGERITNRDHDAVARRACRSSVMAGDKLAAPQAERLRGDLMQCLDPFTCPHGRPTIIELSEGFLDKQFLRT